MKRVYVDASSKNGEVTLVVENGERKVLYESIPRKLHSHEAEMLGIILALKNVKEDVVVINDNLSVMDLLTGKGKVRSCTSGYIEEIKSLCKNRKVEFKHEDRLVNKASLKQHGFSFYEIDNPKILEQSIALRKEVKEKEKRINTRVRHSKSVKKL
jgi:ribonuclease HI